jgi:pseudouridine-5'-phosphate glycosidase
LRRIRSAVLGLVSLAMIVAGVALIGYFFLGGSGGVTNGEEPAAFNVPELENAQETADGGGRRTRRSS